MEIINNRLTPQQKIFFERLSLYIDKPLHFYGSIRRQDYIPGKSDIDLDIFTENESSTIQLLCNFLGVKKNNFKKTVYKINSFMVYGYKGKYEDEINNINLEISVYNIKYKALMLAEHNNDLHYPFYVTILLFIIKYLYYNLSLITKKMYKRMKRLLMNTNDELKFIELDNL